MRSNPFNIIKEIEKKNKEIYPILFYGNEGGLISKLIKSIYDILHIKVGLNEIKYFDHSSDKDDKLFDLLKNNSLFSKIILIVIKNPQEHLIKELDNIKNNKNVVIINGEGIKANSKIKKYFEEHQNFISVPCYNLDKSSIKKIVDDFLVKNSIKLHNEAYWFLIENISENYLILENELQKIYNYKNTSASVEDIKKLIIQKNNNKIDNYFFNCISNNYKIIINDINSSVTSIDHSYEILGSIKKFLKILSNAVVEKNNYNLDNLVRIYLPKYLFMKKEIFKEALKRINITKISKIIKMLQKTEFLLRKNSSQHKEIIERFLLNFAKIMK